MKIENKIKTSIEQEKLENELSHKKYELENLNEEMAKENQELKRQIEDISEELELVRCDLHNRISERDSYERELNECLSQQKEFIDYMEEKIICYENYQNTNLGEYERNLYFDIYNDILEKYKEIIGVSDEKEN